MTVSVTGLATATYHIAVFRRQSKIHEYPADTTFLIAAFDVYWGTTSPAPISSKVAASDCHKTPVSVDRVPVAGSYALLSTYPNPFNPTTIIRYSIARAEIVRLTIHDNLGREVAELANGKKEGGVYIVTFDAGSLSSGVYICRLVAGSTAIASKLLLVK